MRRWILLLLVCPLLSLQPVSAQERSLTHCHYWFDQAQIGETVLDYNGADTLRLSLNTDALSMGIHQFFIRFQDSEGVWSTPHSQMFFVRELPLNTELAAETFEYWMDDNYNERQSIAINNDEASFALQTPTLREGLHTLNYRIKDNNGNYSSLATWLFLRDELRDKSLVNGINAVEYWFDNNVGSLQNVSVEGCDNIEFAVDATGISEGFHTLNYRIQDKAGLFSNISTWLFMRAAIVDNNLAVTEAEYWVDNYSSRQTVTVADSQLSFSLDASELSEGLHTLYYRMKDSSGNFSQLHTWLFLKNEPVATEMAWCEYWWNDHRDKAIHVPVAVGSTVFIFEDELIVPNYAIGDGFPCVGLARLHIAFGDNLGNVSNVIWKDVTYRGDVNADCYVDIADAVTVLNAMAGKDVLGDPDVNRDGKVDIADAVAVLNIMAGY